MSGIRLKHWSVGELNGCEELPCVLINPGDNLVIGMVMTFDDDNLHGVSRAAQRGLGVSDRSNGEEFIECAHGDPDGNLAACKLESLE